MAEAVGDREVGLLVTNAGADPNGVPFLDRAIADYQRGNALKEHCLAKLNEAKLKVEQIQMKPDGTLATTPFATE